MVIQARSGTVHHNTSNKTIQIILSSFSDVQYFGRVPVSESIRCRRVGGGGGGCGGSPFHNFAIIGRNSLDFGNKTDVIPPRKPAPDSTAGARARLSHAPQHRQWQRRGGGREHTHVPAAAASIVASTGSRRRSAAAATAAGGSLRTAAVGLAAADSRRVRRVISRETHQREQ